MISIPWSLRWASRPVRPAVAWLVPGRDARGWLAQLAEGFGEKADLELIVLPTSRQNREPAGVLAAPSASAGFRGMPMMIPYGRILNLYLPVDAILWPPMSEQELSKAMNCEVNVFHPSIGLVGFSRQDCVRMRQLLERPVQRTANWSLARAGLPPAMKLSAVMPVRMPDPQVMLEEGRDDIGEEPVDQAPPAPDEPRMHPMVKAAAMAPLAALAMLLQKMAERLKRKNPPAAKPPGAPARGSGQKGGRPGAAGPGLGDWLSKMMAKGARAMSKLTPGQFAAMSAALQKHRDRELHRLLSLLNNNPDEGLRYALPLTGNRGRGVAPPSGLLGPRDPNFDLSRLDQARPADAWQLSAAMQEQLRANYRRLATRELQLGRHRRAAYILAQLLGDFSSAANALKQGRHYREAAVLYRDKLGQKQEAAGCLCEGGLLLEAIPLYEELSQYERAGDLYSQLEQAEQAEACYRKEVAQLVAYNAHLKAASLLENKLGEPRAALALLDSAWPDKLQAAACLRESFGLLARLKDFPEAQLRVGRMRTAEHSPQVVPPLAQVLAEIAVNFPEDATKHLAFDATKVLVGKRLAGASAEDVRVLMQILAKLSPADRLLARDAQRYVRQLPEPPKPPLRIVPQGMRPPRKSLGQLAVRRSFMLPAGIEWRAFASAGSTFYALGTQFDNAVVLQGFWDGRVSTRSLGTLKIGDYTVESGAYSLVYCDNPAQLWAVHLPYGALQSPGGFPSKDTKTPVDIIMPWLPENALAVACDEQQNGWVLHNEVSGSLEMVLSAYDPSAGRLLSTHSVASAMSSAEKLRLPIPMIARSNHVYVGLGKRVLTLAYGRKWEETALAHPITHLVASHPFTRMRVAAAMEIGGVIFTDGLDSQPVVEGLDFPLMGFSRGGALVAASRTEIRLYRMTGSRPEYRGTWPGDGFDASMPGAAVMPTDRLDSVAFISPKGEVRVVDLGN